MLKRRRVMGFLLLILLLISFPGCTLLEGGENVLRYNLGPEPETLDPALAVGEPELTAILAAFEGLTRLAPGGEIVPGVAEDWQVSPDGCTYTFHLREEARYCNGSPVQAEDFVYAWRRVLAPETASRYAYQLYYIKNAALYNSGELTDPEQVGVRALDEHTLQVELEHPTAYFLSLVAFPTYFPLCREIVEADPEGWWLDPKTYVGNGPFKLDAWEGRQRLRYSRNENYWDVNNVALEGLEFTLVEEPATELALFESGDLDLASHLPAGELVRLSEEGSLEKVQDLAVSFYFINTTRTAPLADALVRRALALAIDRRELVSYVTRGGEEPALAMVPPGIAIGGRDFRQEGGAYFADGDAEGARRLLAEAGYPGGEGIPTLELLLPDGSDYRLVGEAIQEIWRRELGVEVTLVTREWQSFFGTMLEGDFDLAAVAWNADYIDPSSFLEVFLSQGGNNFTGWANSRYDELLAQARAALDPAARRDLYHQAEELLLAEMPAIPLFFPVRHYLQVEDLKGVYFTPLGLVDFKGAVLGGQ